MTIRVAINGYGRIGRNVLRAHYESGKQHAIEIVAINDLGNAETNAHLTRYDTAHGRFNGTVQVEGQHMIVNGDRILVTARRNPAELPWKELNIDVVLECTGLFTTKEKAGMHLQAGAKKVIISAPGGKDVDATIVFGVNHKTLKASDTVISNASCTTNCLAPLVQPLDAKIGLVQGLMTTVHAYTRNTTVEEVNGIMQEAAAGALKGILSYNELPLVSVDFNHNPASCNFDATLTKVIGNLVKVSSWYDNEWGFSNRMLDTTVALAQVN